MDYLMYCIKNTTDINYSGQKLDNLWLVGCCDLDRNGSYNLRNEFFAEMWKWIVK